MGINKSSSELREKKLTIVFCSENKIYDIVDVLRNNNGHVLWNKTKNEWTLANWNEYFELKKQHEQIQKNNDR